MDQTERLREQAEAALKDEWWEGLEPNEREDMIERWVDYMEDCHPELLQEGGDSVNL